MSQSFSYKITTESELYTFDFSQLLSSYETIQQASCQVIVLTGKDSNPASMLKGSALIDNKSASQRLSGGVAGVTYRIVMTVLTTLDNTYVGTGNLSVYEATQV